MWPKILVVSFGLLSPLVGFAAPPPHRAMTAATRPAAWIAARCGPTPGPTFAPFPEGEREWDDVPPPFLGGLAFTKDLQD
jgi:hypothetical protein